MNCIAACMNVRGCDQVGKQNIIGRMIIGKRLDISALCETKMKGSGEFRMGSIRGVGAGVREIC
jgi:hypothetical protein